MIIFPCSDCGRGVRARGEERISCPHCGQSVSVPTPQPMAGLSAWQEVSSITPLLPLDPLPPRAEGQATIPGTDTHSDAPANPERQLSDLLSPPQAPDECGRLGPYRVLRVLGTGGMGVVLQAEDPANGRMVALKALKPSLAASESARRRFLNEARVAAAIRHDHVVYIHHVSEERGIPFLVMEFLEGETLDERIRREGKLSPAEVLRIGRETAAGLAAAHERGLVHRDVKPSNLWLEGAAGRVKVLDFGLARSVDEDAQLTQHGFIVGTPTYMAPEQARGGAIDARTDLFSLGCVLYRLSTGELPFRGSDALSTLVAVGADRPVPPRQVNRKLPPALAELIERLLAKERADRPPSAAAVVEAIRHIESDGTAIRPRRRLTLLAVAAALTATALAAGLYFLLSGTW